MFLSIACLGDFIRVLFVCHEGGHHSREKNTWAFRSIHLIQQLARIQCLIEIPDTKAGETNQLSGDTEASFVNLAEEGSFHFWNLAD